VAALNGELVPNAVNLPGLSSEALAELKPYLNLATKLGRLATSLSDGPISNVEIWTLGNVLPDHARLISMAAQQGLLENQPGLDGPVNLVNARSMAARNGLEVVEKTTTESGPFTGLTISLRVQTGGSASNGDQALQPLGLRVFDGTVINGQPRIVSLNGLMVDVEPSGYMLVSRHIDRPGMIGRVGTALGSYGINIARMEVGRRERAGEAVMILAIDEPVNQAIMEELSKIDGVENLRFVSLGD